MTAVAADLAPPGPPCSAPGTAPQRSGAPAHDHPAFPARPGAIHEGAAW
ncbi:MULTISPECIES: hypothetical protein [Streptosporangium]|uniref:Uncharacterized protein n=1 Tax=Streptosporangium brasiliense TaxID=47480 RepID=A0ABT9QVJ6_9ACTN|nr:hypothetical protein [Streptosporangium brasiliense]MDP9860984.1 hypothetical protein [Streptosporangium brasiliense]